MSPKSLYRWVKKTISLVGRKPRRTEQARPRAFRPGLEHLEERRLLTGGL